MREKERSRFEGKSERARAGESERRHCCSVGGDVREVKKEVKKRKEKG